MPVTAPSLAIPERVDQILDSAADEHPELLDMRPESELRQFIAIEVARIASFESLARQPLDISPANAENIGAIRIHSGVGNYDLPLKEDDNARLIRPWAQWSDRRRIDHGVRIARKVAEVRSGYNIQDHPIRDRRTMREETKALIREFGPYLIYGGYPSETCKAEEVLDRPDTIIPREKAIIVHGNPRNTVEGAKLMAERFPAECLDGGRQAVIVTHAPHLARVLHIMARHPYLPAGSVPYVAPVATPDAGKSEFALMEIRGMLNYTYLTQDSSEGIHPYQTLL